MFAGAAVGKHIPADPPQHADSTCSGQEEDRIQEPSRPSQISCLLHFTCVRSYQLGAFRNLWGEVKLGPQLDDYTTDLGPGSPTRLSTPWDHWILSSYAHH